MSPVYLTAIERHILTVRNAFNIVFSWEVNKYIYFLRVSWLVPYFAFFYRPWISVLKTSPRNILNVEKCLREAKLTLMRDFDYGGCQLRGDDRRQLPSANHKIGRNAFSSRVCKNWNDLSPTLIDWNTKKNLPHYANICGSELKSVSGRRISEMNDYTFFLISCCWLYWINFFHDMQCNFYYGII